MNNEFFGLCSLPLITSEINLCDPWTTSGLQPLGSFKNNSKQELFGRESGEKFIFTKNFGGDQRQGKRQRRVLEKWGQVSSLSLVPQGVHPWVTGLYYNIAHGWPWQQCPCHEGITSSVVTRCVTGNGDYTHCMIRIHISTPSATGCHRLQSHERTSRLPVLYFY